MLITIDVVRNWQTVKRAICRFLNVFDIGYIPVQRSEAIRLAHRAGNGTAPSRIQPESRTANLTDTTIEIHVTTRNDNWTFMNGAHTYSSHSS